MLTFRDLCDSSPHELLLEYVLDQMGCDGRPANIILAVCEVRWPGRTFAVEDDDGDCQCTVYDAIDVKTGESAAEVLKAEYRAGALPKHFHALMPDRVEMEALSVAGRK